MSSISSIIFPMRTYCAIRVLSVSGIRNTQNIISRNHKIRLVIIFFLCDCALIGKDDNYERMLYYKAKNCFTLIISSVGISYLSFFISVITIVLSFHSISSIAIIFLKASSSASE